MSAKRFGVSQASAVPGSGVWGLASGVGGSGVTMTLDFGPWALDFSTRGSRTRPSPPARFRHRGGTFHPHTPGERCAYPPGQRGLEGVVRAPELYRLAIHEGFPRMVKRLCHGHERRGVGLDVGEDFVRGEAAGGDTGVGGVGGHGALSFGRRWTVRRGTKSGARRC